MITELSSVLMLRNIKKQNDTMFLVSAEGAVRTKAWAFQAAL
jgi:hypothetical protein